MGKNVTLNIDAAKKKLSVIKNDVLNFDVDVDYRSLSDEEYKMAGVKLAENEKKLHDLLAEVQGLYQRNHIEFERHRDAGQIPLFDIETIEYVDADGTVLKMGISKETKTTVNRAQLDKETGVQVSVTGNNLDLYTKGSVRAIKKKVLNAVENGKLTGACVTSVTVEQGHFIFDETNKQ